MRKKNKMNVGVSAIAIGASLATLADFHPDVSPSTASLLRGGQFAEVALSIGTQTGALGSVDRTVTGSVNSGFFRTSAIPFGNLAAKKDWNRVRSAKFDTKAQNCNTSLCSQRLAELSETVGQLDSASFFEKLQTVNSSVNQSIEYAPDYNIYNKKDHWAPANQTIKLGFGDCEDYVILKHAMLIQAGVPSSSMSLIVLKDTDRNLYHAVLAVSTNKGHLILDNVVRDVYRDTSIRHYQPLFSFSDDRSWIHGVAEESRNNLLAQGTVPFDAVAPGESTFDVASLGDFDVSWTKDLRPTQPGEPEPKPNWLY